MANMSYCRFENTYNDMVDCYNAMMEMSTERYNQMREEEQFYLWEMIRLAKDIVRQEPYMKIYLEEEA